MSFQLWPLLNRSAGRFHPVPISKLLYLYVCVFFLGGGTFVASFICSSSTLLR